MSKAKYPKTGSVEEATIEEVEQILAEHEVLIAKSTGGKNRLHLLRDGSVEVEPKCIEWVSAYTDDPSWVTHSTASWPLVYFEDGDINMCTYCTHLWREANDE